MRIRRKACNAGEFSLCYRLQIQVEALQVHESYGCPPHKTVQVMRLLDIHARAYGQLAINATARTRLPNAIRFFKRLTIHINSPGMGN
jgi:hypothetical protein